MSRRCHHGSPRHLRQAARERRRGPVVADRPSTPADHSFDTPEGHAEPVDITAEPSEQLDREKGAKAEADAADEAPIAGSMEAAPAPTLPRGSDDPSVAEPPPVALPAPARPLPEPERAARPGLMTAPAIRPPHRPREATPDADAGPGDLGLDRGATAPQLRRFIKSRAYVPMHELRRRFGINGGDDDVIPIDVERQRVYVGLPPREGSLLGELLRAGDIGYELSMDPIAPIVVGVYPMRPVPRS